MAYDRKSDHEKGFRDFLKGVEPIRLREPLAETLGAFKKEGVDLEYTFIDVVKMAGHACPTTAGAYLCCQKALERLYPNETPVRGNISVIVHGEPDEGVYGVVGQVFSLLTGAVSITGFKGLGACHKFKRKDLLEFSMEKLDPEAMCFEFTRLDNDRGVLIRFYPRKVPFAAEKSKRLGELMEKVVWEAAKDDEIKEFQNLWMEKLEDMLLKREKVDEWIKIEERGPK